MNDDLELVRGFLKDRLNIDPLRVKPEATLDELEVDSLVLLELFFEFEEKLNVNLSPDLPTPKTIGQLLGIVSGLRGSPKAG
jgi:acyl carrier protein